MKKIVTVLGARPQFIKAAVVSREIKNYFSDTFREVIIHTGQHYDKNMSDIFFEEMEIPRPDYFLNINGLSHGAMTGQMLQKIEAVLVDEKPDWVLVYGDTNSTLAGALAAQKLHIKIAHVEAGLRSFNMDMPEEINRILTDRISNILFCPTDTAIKNLKREGFDNFECNMLKTGDVMYDAAMFYSAKSHKNSTILKILHQKYPSFNKTNYVLATIHRQENTDIEENLRNIFQAFEEISKQTQIILPLHPRTKKKLECAGIDFAGKNKNMMVIDPVGYMDIIQLLKHCSLLLTDSGGMQKEAYFFQKICLTLREQTEWTELTDSGVNYLCGADNTIIMEKFQNVFNQSVQFPEGLYGKGNAANQIIKYLSDS